jgi:hypothetical protein
MLPGVSPTTDFTNLDAITYVDADKVRFINGRLRKLKGWQRLFSTNFQRLAGCARAMYSYIPSDGFPRVLIGTSTRLYVWFKGDFYNITPLVTGTTAIANSLGTVFINDAAYSVTTTSGSAIVTFNIPHFLNPGELVKITGVSGTIGGITAGNFNATFTVLATPSSSTFQVRVAATASSSATGGGTGITFITQQILVTIVDHGFSKGDRIKLASSSDVGGILAAAINTENVITAIISDDVFAIDVGAFATSSVSGGGGSDVTIQGQISSGNCDQSVGTGYGGGLYGVGLYGVPKQFAIAVQVPRIWSFDRFGDNVVLTPGGQQGVYIWANNPVTAPALQTNAPTANWVYQSNNMVVVLGADGSNGTFANSNAGNANDWTFTQVDLVFVGIVYGASKFISQASSRNVDVLFTQDKVYQVRFVGLPIIWNVQELFDTDGLIGPKARVNIQDAVFWMGYGDFYVFDGTSVNILPNNTVKRYVYDNINQAQDYKVFASANPAYDEIWWFYPAGADTEPNNYVIYNYKEQHWTIGTLTRTAAAEPANATAETFMVESHATTQTLLGANPLSTNFYTLGANPITATNTSASIVIAIPGHHLEAGDSITVAGSTAVHGITTGEINAILPITAVTIGTVTATAGGTATSSGTGGGSSITVATQVVTVTASNTFNNDSQVTLQNAVGFDGISTGDLSGTFGIRQWSTSAFDISVPTTYSTSSGSGGGTGVEMSYSRTGRLFQHEVGNDDYDDVNCDSTDQSSCLAPMNCYATTNYAQIAEGDTTMLIYSVIPDSTQVGNMSLSVSTKLYPQSATVTPKGPYTISENTIKVDVMAVGRQRQYKISSNELGQTFITGKWFEQVTQGTPI